MQKGRIILCAFGLFGKAAISLCRFRQFLCHLKLRSLINLPCLCRSEEGGCHCVARPLQVGACRKIKSIHTIRIKGAGICSLDSVIP